MAPAFFIDYKPSKYLGKVSGVKLMLKVTGIRKAFKNNEVLKGVDLEVNKGDVVSILGPSGSGKTTLLRCINFLEHADAGQLDFDEQHPDRGGRYHRKRRCGRGSDGEKSGMYYQPELPRGCDG